MMKSAFSSVGYVKERSPIGKVMFPLTALPFLLLRVSVTVVISCFLYAVSQTAQWTKILAFLLINIINPKQSSGKGGGFAEGNEEGLMDLSLGFDEDAAEEEDEAT